MVEYGLKEKKNHHINSGEESKFSVFFPSRCIYQSKKEVKEQFGSRMNQDVNGNKKLFWKEEGKANSGKVESCSRKKKGNGR